uniref:Uncharacterized protein n=1 Tax=Oryza sativa subsp. japonica TaxID=39947 RepID=Q6YUN7_ORYSJ|nr:hypothetical protein [Oryza sativa Japonica Group]BAD17557.1 hypothetical protein [Oryza sativa Japonica Group]
MAVGSGCTQIQSVLTDMWSLQSLCSHMIGARVDGSSLHLTTVKMVGVPVDSEAHVITS